MPCAEWMFFRLLNILRQAGALLSSMWSVVLAATLIVYGTNTVKGVSKDFLTQCYKATSFRLILTTPQNVDDRFDFEGIYLFITRWC